MNAQAARSLGLLATNEAFTVNFDWLRVCKGVLQRAAVLWAYVWREREECPDQYIQLTEEQLGALLANTFDAKTIREARRWLVQEGILSAKRGPHNAVWCKLDRKRLQELVRQECGQASMAFPQADSVRETARTESGKPPGQTEDPAGPVRTISRTLIGSNNGGGVNNNTNHHGGWPPSVENNPALWAAIQEAVRDLEIGSDRNPDRPLQRICETLSKAPLRLQRHLLEKLGDLAHRIRSGRKKDVSSWGYLSDTVQIWFDKATTAPARKTRPVPPDAPPLAPSAPSEDCAPPSAPATHPGAFVAPPEGIEGLLRVLGADKHPQADLLRSLYAERDLKRKGVGQEVRRTMTAAAGG